MSEKPLETSGNATIAVTGVTGALGGAVARHLSDAGIALRLLARTPGRATVLPHSHVVACSYDDSAATIAALRETDVLFMVSASESADRLRQHFAFIDAARAAGVRHIVYTSFQGAAPDATFTLARDHFATEQYLAASGLSWTILRDSFYLDFLPDLVGADGVIRGPAGEGRVAAVAREDIARAAAHVLRSPHEHAGVTYTLTGSQALTLTEVAENLTRETGRDIRFHDESIDEAYASRAKWNAPPWQQDAWVSTYTAIAAGELAAVSDDVRTLTGALPITLAELVRRR